MTHVGFVTGATAQARYGDYIAHLEIGPALFFLISGFLLYRTYVAGNFAGREPMPAGCSGGAGRCASSRPTGSRSRCSSSCSGCTSRAGARSFVYYGLLQIYDTHRFLGRRFRRPGRCAPRSASTSFLPAYAWVLRSAGRGRDARRAIAARAASAPAR